MKLTKYNHACFTVEKDDQIIVIDPGGFSADFIAPENVVAIVITHQHSDHFDHEQIEAIVDKNPDAIIIAHQAITSQIEVFTTREVNAADRVDVGPFHLAFLGGEHALIHSSIPRIPNLGVLINDLIYYPGDSFVLPSVSVDTLALPVSAPWMKMSEAIDFLLAIHPRLAFSTHDALLSNEGKEITDRLLSSIASPNGIEYRRLIDSIEI